MFPVALVYLCKGTDECADTVCPRGGDYISAQTGAPVRSGRGSTGQTYLIILPCPLCTLSVMCLELFAVAILSSKLGRWLFCV